MGTLVGDLNELRGLLGEEAVRTDADALAEYGRDWVRTREARAAAVVFPADTEQTAALVQWARRTRTALVPSGGRTGLAGGALADNGQVVVSCERMNKVLGISSIDRLLTAQAGVVKKISIPALKRLKTKLAQTYLSMSHRPAK